MALRLPLLTFLLFFLLSTVYSQDSSYKVRNTKFLRFVRDARFNGCQFATFLTPYAAEIVNFKERKLRVIGQNPLIVNGEIYLYIPSSGIVYKANGSKELDTLVFTRIDNTEHYDYNINNFSFAHNNAIYNIGGYGFWHWNGQLRKFSFKQAEWDIVLLDREIPVSNQAPGAHFWKSPDHDKIFTFSYVKGNEAVRSKQIPKIQTIDSVIKLDLNTYSWSVMGQLNSKLKTAVDGPSMRASLDSGILVDNTGTLQYLNVLDNTIYESNNRELIQIFSPKNNPLITWGKDGKIFYYNFRTEVLDSFLLSSAKFINTKEKVFVNSRNKKLIITVVSVLLILISLVLIFKKKMHRLFSFKGRGVIEKNNLNSPYKSKEVFNEVEKALLNLLLNNKVNKGSSTSTEEVNRILGVGNKSLDMQKRKRSDVIRAVNSKYQLLYPESDIILIERSKSEVDARLYEYTVNSDLEFLKDHET